MRIPPESSPQDVQRSADLSMNSPQAGHRNFLVIQEEARTIGVLHWLCFACRMPVRRSTEDRRRSARSANRFIPKAPVRRSSQPALRDEQAAHVRGFRFGLGPSLRTKVLDQGEHDEDQHDDTEEPSDHHSAHHFQPRRSRPLGYSSSSIPRKRSRDRVLAGCDPTEKLRVT